MPFKPASSLSPVQISMLALGALTVAFIWALFVFNLSSARSDALAARQAEHRNLALIVSESLKQMTDRARAMASLTELDVGYLAGLIQHIEFGDKGFIQVLDADGREWMRADTSGVIVGGTPLPRIKPALNGQVSSGQSVFEVNEQTYQTVFVTRPAHGFTVSVSEPFSAILGPLRSNQNKQLVINILMTLVVAGIVFWLARGLKQQQKVLRALQLSELKNHQLIQRLEGEHARSSRAATVDHLSGLFNRRQFLEVAPDTLVEQRRKRSLSALLFIDLDRFKSVNDSLGHHVGDLLLQAVAGRIRKMLGPGDAAARFGGDEFVVLLAGDRTESDIEQWSAGLAGHLSSPYELNGKELNSTPSIGIAICPRDGQNIEDLLRCADAAMYSAKNSGRGQHRFFDKSLNRKDVEAFHLEQSFSDALRNREFVLHYQPQVCLDTMEIDGYEALVRWKHPEFGTLYPDRFITMAETCGFIIPLGLEVLRLACAQFAQWKAEGLPVKPIAVNVSPIQLTQPEFCWQVMALVDEYGLRPDQLELEITETAMLDASAVDSLHGLKAEGIKLSLDDFGTGYSGFGHLEAVPVDKLKIDRSLISKISNSHDDSPVVSSTIILAKRMHLKVVAEGVETREQLVHLKVAGCDIAQGYHISRPIPPEQIPDFVRSFNRLEAAV